MLRINLPHDQEDEIVQRAGKFFARTYNAMISNTEVDFSQDPDYTFLMQSIAEAQKSGDWERKRAYATVVEVVSVVKTMFKYGGEVVEGYWDILRSFLSNEALIRSFITNYNLLDRMQSNREAFLEFGRANVLPYDIEAFNHSYEQNMAAQARYDDPDCEDMRAAKAEMDETMLNMAYLIMMGIAYQEISGGVAAV